MKKVNESAKGNSRNRAPKQSANLRKTAANELPPCAAWVSTLAKEFLASFDAITDKELKKAAEIVYIHRSLQDSEWLYELGKAMQQSKAPHSSPVAPPVQRAVAKEATPEGIALFEGMLALETAVGNAQAITEIIAEKFADLANGQELQITREAIQNLPGLLQSVTSGLAEAFNEVWTRSHPFTAPKGGEA